MQLLVTGSLSEIIAVHLPPADGNISTMIFAAEGGVRGKLTGKDIETSMKKRRRAGP